MIYLLSQSTPARRRGRPGRTNRVTNTAEIDSLHKTLSTDWGGFVFMVAERKRKKTPTARYLPTRCGPPPARNVRPSAFCLLLPQSAPPTGRHTQQPPLFAYSERKPAWTTVYLGLCYFSGWAVPQRAVLPQASPRPFRGCLRKWHNPNTNAPTKDGVNSCDTPSFTAKVRSISVT